MTLHSRESEDPTLPEIEHASSALTEPEITTVTNGAGLVTEVSRLLTAGAEEWRTASIDVPLLAALLSLRK